MKKNYWIIALVLLLLGSIMLYVQAAFCKDNMMWNSITGNAASALLICGIFNLFQEIFVRKDSDKKMSEMFNLSSSITRSGLEELMVDSREYDFKPLVEGATRFVAVMNDGYTWLVHNDFELRKRFDTPGTTTEFYLVDPDGVGGDYLSNKCLPSYDIKFKILQTVDELKAVYSKSEKKGRLVIKLMEYAPTQSVFIADGKVVITLYQNGSYKQIVPLFVFQKDNKKSNIAQYYQEDLESMQSTCKVEFDSLSA